MRERPTSKWTQPQLAFRGGLALAVLAGLLVAGCRPAAPLTPVVVQLNWLHYAPFSGFYAAQQRGFYQTAGLDVSFLAGGPTADYITPVLDGRAHFGVAGADEILLARAAGKPLHVIAVILRRSPVAFVAPADSGIARPRDFVGKTIRLTSQVMPQFSVMMARVGVTPDQYRAVTLPSEVALFAAGQADVWSVYVNSFAVTLERAGYRLNYVYPDDYGVHFYADAVFTTDTLLAGQPDLALRFLRATLQGYAYVVENPSVAGALTVQYDPKADPALENAKMLASIPLISTGEHHIGWMTAPMWAGMEQTLRQYQTLPSTFSVSQVYTMQFLEQIYAR